MSNVWIIDDDAIASFYISRLCELSETVDIVTVFSNAKQAMQSLSEAALHPEMLPDIILLDIYMPVVSGWDFMLRFQELLPTIAKEIKVYIMSSSVHMSDALRAKGNRLVSDYLTKPVTLDVVRSL